jgi:hypothetical protein
MSSRAPFSFNPLVFLVYSFVMMTLPEFPDFRPVCLEDKDCLESSFREIQPEISELNFTNLFIFRHVHDYKLSRLRGSILILAKSYAGEPYFMPPVGGSEIPAVIDEMFGYLSERGQGPVMDLVWKGFLEKYVASSEKYGYKLDEDNSDYLYKAGELATLAGRKFHDKKNLLNRFMKSYKYEYARLTKDLVHQARDLTVRWCDDKCSCDVPSTFGETEATMVALDNLDRLSMTGAVVIINGKVEALALGEELNRETVVIHVEKANAEFNGLYQFISSQFIARDFAHYTYVNREQDLGEPNLRKSKLSYNPTRMVEKYRVWPK